MIKRAAHISLFQIFSLNSQGLQSVTAFSITARVAGNTEFYFWFWSRSVLPSHSWRMFWSWVWYCCPSAPVPTTGNVAGPWPRGAETGPSSATSSLQCHQLPPVPPAPLQSWLAHRSCNTCEAAALGQRVAHILTPPRAFRSRRQGCSLHSLPPGKGKPERGFTAKPKPSWLFLCSSLSVCSPGCWIPLLETGDGAKTRVLGLDLLSVLWVWCLSSTASDGSVQDWQWGNSTGTNGCCSIPSPPPQFLGQTSLSLSSQNQWSQ